MVSFQLVQETTESGTLLIESIDYLLLVSGYVVRSIFVYYIGTITRSRMGTKTGRVESIYTSSKFQNANALFSISSSVMLLRWHIPRNMPFSSLYRLEGVSNSWGMLVKSMFACSKYVQLLLRRLARECDHKKGWFVNDLCGNLIQACKQRM